MERTLLVIPGDGVGVEVTAAARRVAAALIDRARMPIRIEEAPMGMQALREHGALIPAPTMAAARRADAILFGASGGPDFDALPRDLRRAGSVLQLRQTLGLYVNLRPVKPFPALLNDSPLKPAVISAVDMIIVREANGGIYFGEPRGIAPHAEGGRRGVNTEIYSTPEIERIARAAFRLARTRGRRVCSVEKSNVLESGLLWREDVTALRDREFSDVALSHMYVDNCAMQLVRAPAQFDVLLTTNMFGDILSDCAAPITGSLGMLPSASLNLDAAGRPVHALYEPVHGSAPDIAGRGIANPIGAILSLALALRYSFDAGDVASRIEAAVASALDTGVRTADIATAGTAPVNTQRMTEAVLAHL